MRAVEDLAKFGVKVNRITVGSPEAEPVWRSKTGKDANPQVWLVLAGLLVALVSLVQILMLEQRTGELNLLIEARQARISLLEQRLSQLEASAEESVARQQALEADAAVFQLQSQRLKVLTDLGVLLPDSVWISELTVSEDRMTLAGFSRDEVSEVVSILQSAPWARTVELDGAVSFDAYSGQSRFMISVTLKPAEASP